jgi:transcriptional regulator with XRE-family HTH domain
MTANRSKLTACAIPASWPHDRLVVATTVRMARAALGWSQVEFGRRLGMTQRSVHRIEQGHSEPRLTTLLAIEHLLRRAGLKIEHRNDGGFCIVVPASVLEHREPPDVAAPSLTAPSLTAPSLTAPSLTAPSLADCDLMPDAEEDTEASTHSHAVLDPSIGG